MLNYKNIIIDELEKMGMTLSIAESVTGGMISSALVDIEGASKVFKGGVVSYTAEAKNKLLSVRTETIEKYGEVSQQVAKEMAIGIKNKLNTDFSIAVTGYATPIKDNAPSSRISVNEPQKCLVFFCIIAVDVAYEFEMLNPDEGR
ncbi:MAG: CinA family protein, partial [Malacoplasma sp.]